MSQYLCLVLLLLHSASLCIGAALGSFNTVSGGEVLFGLSKAELASVKALTSLLIDQDCVHGDAKDSFDSLKYPHVTTPASPSRVDPILPKFMRAEAHSSVTVPCETTNWLREGRWTALSDSLSSGVDGGIITAKCLSPIRLSSSFEEDCGVQRIFQRRSSHHSGSCRGIFIRASGGMTSDMTRVADAGCDIHVISDKPASKEFVMSRRLAYYEVPSLDLGDNSSVSSLDHSMVSATGVNGDSAVRKSIGQVMKDLIPQSFGTDNSSTSLYFDCMGCELNVFPFLNRYVPNVLEHMDDVILKLDLEALLEADVSSHLKRIALLYDEILKNPYFKIWYRRLLEPDSFTNGRSDLHSALNFFGISPGRCKYELGLHRVRENSIKVDESKEQILTMKKNKTINVFANFPQSMNNFREFYMAVSGSNLTFALLQNDPAIHSETIGPYVELLKSAGIKRIIIYYDLYYPNTTRPVELTVLPTFHGFDSWDIRPSERCVRETDQWDYLVLITGDETYRRSWVVDAIRHIPERLLAIHHHPKWLIPDLFPRVMFLTPTLSRQRWFFPFFHFPENFHPPLDLSFMPLVIQEKFSEALFLLGSIGTLEHNIISPEGAKYKDILDIQRFLRNDETNVILYCAKEEMHMSSILPMTSEFPKQVAAFVNLNSFEISHLIRFSKYLWIPIPKDSIYMTGCFVSSLSFGFAYRKVMIMPRHISELYGLQGAVVEYNTSILEINLSAIDEKAILKRMDAWERAQRIQNIMNFYKCMSTNCV